MKKIFLIMISVFLGIILVACGNISTTTIFSTQASSQATTTITTTITTSNTTLSKLATPTDVLISNNVITFNTVVSATKYRITIFDDNDTVVGHYNIINGFDLSLILQVGNYKYQLIATGTGVLDSNPTMLTMFEIIDTNRISILEGNDMNNFDFIRWLGRTYYDDTEFLKYFYYTASGFELAFFGTELKVTFVASNFNNLGKQPYIVALIDGEEDPTKGTLIVLNKQEAEYTICSELVYGYHTVKILKRSETIDSNSAVKNVTTDGYFTTPPAPKSFKIQYIAASSSTGYGNLGNLTIDKTSANSNGLLAYAYLSSYLLDAEASVVAASGWGVSRGYNTGGNISETENIPNAFEYIAIDASNVVLKDLGKWDITNYIPDVIVVNLGTNDFNASGYNYMTDEQKVALETRFKTDYVKFLILLNNMYPNAKIIVAYGLMNEQNFLGDITLDIIAKAAQSVGENVFYSFVMEGAGTNNNPFGCNYHPNVQTSMNVAEALAAFISSITGREVVREMVTNN